MAIIISIWFFFKQDRRLQAIKEMARVLVRGGRGLIYVWAKNQEQDCRQSSYLRQNKRNLKKEPQNEEHVENIIEYVDGLPVHTNRTQFAHQDMLVPWKLKSECDNENAGAKKTFLRYYHVFEEQELEKLCESILDVKVIKSYYDQGNWCVIFQKE